MAIVVLMRFGMHDSCLVYHCFMSSIVSPINPLGQLVGLKNKQGSNETGPLDQRIVGEDLVGIVDLG